jgi:hypothetical protein
MAMKLSALLTLSLLLPSALRAALELRERTPTAESPEFIRRIHRAIRALDWEPRDNWIHHDPFNVADAFHLDWDEVNEAREAAVRKLGLRQI